MAAPQHIQLRVSWPKKRNQGGLPLKQKRFYLSSDPFGLEKILPNLAPLPSRRSYYEQLAREQGKSYEKLIEWLETNNCDTVYCRPLEEREVTCTPDPKNNCVPEFVEAYNKALAELKDPDRARRWITNYAPLSAPELRDGFYTKKKNWLSAAIEKAKNLPPGTLKNQDLMIQSAFTDMSGTAYFRNLCPGTTYFISNIAPIEVGGKEIIWEIVAKTSEDGKTPGEKIVYLNENDGKKIPLPSSH